MKTNTPSPHCLPLGVCAWPSPPFNTPHGTGHPQYLFEILDHAGLAYSRIEPVHFITALPQLRVLVTVGESPLADDVKQALRQWVAGGGAWLSIGGLCGLGDLLGADYVAPEYTGRGFGVMAACILGEGYLEVTDEHPALGGVRLPLHFFNGQAVRATDGRVLARVLDKHGRRTDRAAVVECNAGGGPCLVVAPDVTGSVVRIQQGICVTRDGISAPDGISPVSDGALKSDDGAVLDWDFDRVEVPGFPGLKGYLEPIADAWREVVLRSIFHLATLQDVRLPVLWLYPRNLPMLAHLSHDSDGNDDAAGQRMLDAVAEAGIKSTWCIIDPGYGAGVMDGIQSAGHELSMHYDAVSDGRPWGEDQFDSQWQSLQQIFGAGPVSNKNHYTRWEGDTEFFHWCRDRGIQLDQSKGVSKIGEVGFNFGTCHLYFPVEPNGDIIDVLEQATIIQDLVIFAPPPVGHILADAALRHHGVLHVLFHPAHIDKDGVKPALLGVVEHARQLGAEWWTAAQLNAWERARREVRWSVGEDGGTQLATGAALPGTTLLWLGSAGSGARVNGETYEPAGTTRWGFDFHAVTLDLGQNLCHSIESKPNA